MSLRDAFFRAGFPVLVLVLLLISSVDAQKKNKNKGEGGVGGGGENSELNGQGNSTDTEVEEKPTGPPLTGNPQLDYIHDPNLPHELMNYDLSDYPFYKRVPKEGHNFTCDGRLDGFYASPAHKCQVRRRGTTGQ